MHLRFRQCRRKSSSESALHRQVRFNNEIKITPIIDQDENFTFYQVIVHHRPKDQFFSRFFLKIMIVFKSILFVFFLSPSDFGSRLVYRRSSLGVTLRVFQRIYLIGFANNVSKRTTIQRLLFVIQWNDSFGNTRWTTEVVSLKLTKAPKLTQAQIHLLFRFLIQFNFLLGNWKNDQHRWRGKWKWWNDWRWRSKLVVLSNFILQKEKGLVTLFVLNEK